jgi:hypothetical protein
MKWFSRIVLFHVHVCQISIIINIRHIYFHSIKKMKFFDVIDIYCYYTRFDLVARFFPIIDTDDAERRR